MRIKGKEREEKNISPYVYLSIWWTLSFKDFIHSKYHKDMIFIIYELQNYNKEN